MWDKIIADPVATYAAVLSTLIAVAAGVQAVVGWMRSGPQAWAAIINPLDVGSFNHRLTLLVISNTGRQPIVVGKVRVSVHTGRSKTGEIRSCVFDHTNAGWNPSVELVPNPTGKGNSSVPQPRIIHPGHEMHQHLQPFPEYDPQQHWFRAEVYLRHRQSPIVAWAAPVPADPPTQPL